MLNRLWSSVSTIGLQEGYDERLAKRIVLTNQFSVIAFTIFLLSGINNFMLGDAFSGTVLEGFAAICLSGFWINKLHLHRFAVSFLFISISLAVFYFDSYSGLASGTFLYHFPLILAIAFLFDVKKDRSIMFFHFTFILALLAINVLTHYTLFESRFLTANDRYGMFAFNLPFSSAAVGFFIYRTVANNNRESILYKRRIEEQQAAELALKQALHEKEILLAELHHRVKNNLAVIAGLFNLKLNSTPNDEARNVLVECRNRVKSMALIHDRLYKSDSLSNINFVRYIEELVREISASYPGQNKNIVVHTHIQNINLNVNTAIPLGLLLNELLSNCYKHAFTGRDSGNIEISFIREGDQIKLMVADNGIGISPGYDQTESIGVTVILSLAEQLDGACSFINKEGTRFELSFSLPENQ
ncbi:MAG: sensor histidine kinase [Bacteroidetes bacterium]|nr:sensor histidine kinase [Bacteroidota bacterium]